MTSRAHLLLACAALAALAAPAHAQGQCYSAQIGNVTGDVYSTVERRVLPDTFTLELSEPDMCPEAEPVGLQVTACDADEAPRVHLLDAARGVVVREGALRTDAFVYITTFCSDSGQVAYDYSEPINESSQSSKQTLPYLSSQPTFWIGSPSGVESPSPQPLPTSPSVPPEEVEGASITLSVTESPQSDTESENEPIPIQFESRFASVSKDPLAGRPSPVNLLSRLKETLPEQPKRPPIPTPEELSSLWKQRKPTLEKLKRPFESNRLHDNETLTSPALGQPGRFDSYSSLMNKILSSYSKDPMSSWSQRPSSSWTEPALPSLAKRLPELRPENTSPWLLNRSPAWLKRPTKRPSTSWLRQESLPEWPTRKSLSRPRTHEQWWSPYNDGALLSQSEEVVDTFPRSHHSELPPQSHPSPSSIQHITKKHHRYVPPIHEEDETADWQDQLSKRSSLPKLLLLLQEQEQPPPTNPHPPPTNPHPPPAIKMKICEPSHSVEDSEPWWSNAVSEHSEDSNLWQTDYAADYTADDGEPFPRPLSPGLTSYKEHSGSASAQWLERPDAPPSFVTESPVQPCIKCPPVNAIEERKLIWPRHSRVSKEQLSSSQIYRRPALEHSPHGSPRFGHNHPKAHTERPLMLSATPRHAPWPSSAMPEGLSSSEQGEHPASAHWSYLSKLLLSHPAFRDSTHVIRI